MSNENKQENYEVIVEAGSVPIKHWTKGVQFEDSAKKQLANMAKLPFVFRHIAVCPDVHAGKGSVVGSVIATDGAIVPAFVGVDIGCFSGETLIPLTDGKNYSIKDLVDINKQINVWSCTEDGHVFAVEAKAKLTRKDAKVLKLILDNGNEIVCTYDQKIMLRNGQYIEAEKLETNMSLMPFYSIKDKYGYLMIRQNYNGSAQRAHWIIARSGLLGEIPNYDGGFSTAIYKKDGYTNSYYSPIFDIIVGDGYGKFGNNHKILKIEFINELQDVYCLQVPEYNNFAISAGIFVHNCGMLGAKTNLKRADFSKSLVELRQKIECELPHGRTDNGGRNDVGAWQQELPDIVKAAWMGLEGGYKEICKKNPRIYHERVEGQLGTLGTGNHMCEISIDPDENIWILIHSGSRGPGAKIASHFVALAKKEMNRWYIKLPGNDYDLSYFPDSTEYFGDYLEAANWAAKYAAANREIMSEIVLKVLHKDTRKNIEIDTVINCHHNYVVKEKHFGQQIYLTRKGAISARLGELGIIPGSMGDKTYIVEGLGNRESFYSASHGAGRMMSRTEATKTFSVKDHIAATEGVECKKDSSVIDETPKAYKPIDLVIAAESDLVKPVTTIKQILCIKG